MWLKGESNPSKRPGVRAKLSQSKMGDKNPAKRPEVRKKISQKLKLSLHNKGENNVSKRLDVRLKISEKMKGRKCPWNVAKNKNPEFRKKVGDGVRGFHHTEETKKLLREQHLGKMLGSNNPSRRLEVRKKISQKLTGRVFSDKTKEKLRIARFKQKLPFKDTDIELLLQDSLRKRGIDFSTNVSLKGITQADIVIQPNIAIFVDGCYWHCCPIHCPNSLEGRRENDIKITESLEDYGWIVLRFWEHEINSNVDYCIDKILENIQQTKQEAKICI